MVKKKSFHKRIFWHLRSGSSLGALTLLATISPVVMQGLSILQPETSSAIAQYRVPKPPSQNGGPPPNQR
jgi:hypothetical protein